MTEEIVEKLKVFVTGHPQFKQECEVVYLMVELRKLLDRGKEEGIVGNYPLVRFYADWIVHTQKDHISQPIKAVMEKVDQMLDPFPKQGDVEFLLMPEFREELLQLLKESGIPSDFCLGRDKWKEFAITLTNVLSNQPLVKPTRNISEFCYITATREHIAARVEFNDDRAGISLFIAVDTF